MQADLAAIAPAEDEAIAAIGGSKTKEALPTIPSGYGTWKEWLGGKDLSKQDILGNTYADVADANGNWKLDQLQKISGVTLTATKIAPEAKNATVHAHHIVMKGNRFPENFLARQILRKWDIDPFTGKENLVWGPNWSHSGNYAEAVLKMLQDADKRGKNEVIKALKQLAIGFISGKFSKTPLAGDTDDDI